MTVYRICLAKYATALYASGNSARWNSKDVKIIYTPSSRALACLEHLVHRNALGLKQLFKVMLIEIPDDLTIGVLKKEDLENNWSEFSHYPNTQEKGDAWVARNDSAVLQVPSAIIQEEFNYLLNPAHPDFAKIKLVRTEDFDFDPRIKD